MKLTFFSDTHNQHSLVKIGSGDVLVHCGDFTRKGSLDDVHSFAVFMAQQNFNHKIVIAGNHDFSFEDERRHHAESILKDNGIIYLNDSGVEIDGVHFWGSPIQPTFFDWAFNRERGAEIKRHWDLIPDGIDVLVTHGPPAKILDRCIDGSIVGCEDLLNTVKRVRPKIHVFGHIHESYGIVEIDGTKFINACSLDERYRFANQAVDVDFKKS